MLIREKTKERLNPQVKIDVDLAIVGGGLSGLCCAVMAARKGIKVALVQDRPVLGGNASSEIRVWALGATSHMGNNNRWAREGGLIDEIMVENLHRNKEGNPILFDALLLEHPIASEQKRLRNSMRAFHPLRNTGSC
jgi:glycine/D-amino acid oxidase-like deaminating enzyme